VGRRFSNGEVYTGNELVAAAKDLPFGTLLRIKNPATGKTIVVRVVDRFREHKGRILDVSKAAAEMLGFKAQGIANVLVEVIGHVKKVGGK
jgi:rare lipoprotein A